MEGHCKLHLYSIFKQNYHILAERPGVARENLKFEKKITVVHPPATHECPQKNEPNRSNRLAGYTRHVYNVLFY